MSRVQVIDLHPIQEYCWACGEFVIPLRHGLPVYEDEILPNDWEGEWGGVPSCPRCYDLQALLTEPMSLAKFRRLIGAESE
jgi:hypothetical protein